MDSDSGAGELRGGRFVEGFAGEQFALPDAVSMMKSVRRKKDMEQMIAISSADPLNLTGIITPGKRVTASASNRILYKDGKPVATSQSGEVVIDEGVPMNDHVVIRTLLTRKRDGIGFYKGDRSRFN